MDGPNLKPESLRVLRVLRTRAMDGYTLQSRTELKPAALTDALRELESTGVVIVKGDLNSTSVGDVYAYVPPNANGYVDMLLSNFRTSAF